MNLKVGDILICHKKLSMYDNALTINKIYEINNVVRDHYVIINDYSEKHWFSYKKNNHSYYKQWFYSLKDIRKKKIEKLNNFNHE